MCNVGDIKHGRKVASRAIKMPDGKAIKEVDDEGYKYLRVLEGAGIMS